MTQSLLTPTVITREALRVLHQKLNFVGSIDRQYDSQFAKTGAKIGSNLSIRMPNQFTVRTGKTLDTQDVTESTQTLTLATQKGVDMNFSSVELTMTIDDFSKRYIDPAMSALAATVEADAMTMFKDVYNNVYGSSLTYTDLIAGRVQMNRALTPQNGRMANLSSQDVADLIIDNKALFNQQSELSGQFREGMIGHQAGFDFVENVMWPGFTTQNEDGNYVCNTSTGITSGTATIALTAGANGLLTGDVFTIAGVYSVNPETKLSTGVLQNFVATADYTSGSVSVSPTPYTSGAKQNISVVSAGSGKVVVVAGTANKTYTTSLLYQKEAFAFVTADLDMPGGVDFGRRETLDGISLRIVRQYDINNDNMPCRIDILYGYKTLRPGFATRLHYHPV